MLKTVGIMGVSLMYYKIGVHALGRMISNKVEVRKVFRRKTQQDSVQSRKDADLDWERMGVVNSKVSWR